MLLANGNHVAKMWSGWDVGSFRGSCSNNGCRGCHAILFLRSMPPEILSLAVLFNLFLTRHVRSISVTLFLLASWLVLYGIRLQRRVMGHPR